MAGGPIDRIVAWLRAGYPEGIPAHDSVPLMALLSRRMTDDEIDEVSASLASSGLVVPTESHVGAEMVRVMHELPSSEEIHRVARKLRAMGWSIDDGEVPGQGEPQLLCPTVHLFYGPAGSGKTRRSRQLADAGAIRFSRAQAMKRIHPELTRGMPGYADACANVEAVLWGIAKQVLASGGDVVLDWNARTRAIRRHIVEDAHELGAEVVVHNLATQGRRGSQPPSEDEGLRIMDEA